MRCVNKQGWKLRSSPVCVFFWGGGVGRRGYASLGGVRWRFLLANQQKRKSGFGFNYSLSTSYQKKTTELHYSFRRGDPQRRGQEALEGRYSIQFKQQGARASLYPRTSLLPLRGRSCERTEPQQSHLNLLAFHEKSSPRLVQLGLASARRNGSTNQPPPLLFSAFCKQHPTCFPPLTDLTFVLLRVSPKPPNDS